MHDDDGVSSQLEKWKKHRDVGNVGHSLHKHVPPTLPATTVREAFICQKISLSQLVTPMPVASAA